MMKFDKIRAKLKHRNNNVLIKPILCFGYKTFEFGINPAKGPFSIGVSCKFVLFTKIVNI